MKRYLFPNWKSAIESFLNAVPSTAGRSITVCEGRNSVDFVVQLLGLLRLKRPMAIFSPSWTQKEQEARLGLLNRSESSLHPECAVVVFTSGSMGQPKAVPTLRPQHRLQRPSRHPFAGLRTSSRANAIPPTSLLFWPFWPTPSGITRRSPYAASQHSYGGQGAARHRRGLGMWSGVPSHWETILRLTDSASASLERVSHVVSAGAPLSLALRQRLKARFPNATLHNNYGLTEASPRVLCLSRPASPLFSAFGRSPCRGFRSQDRARWRGARQRISGHAGISWKSPGDSGENP